MKKAAPKTKAAPKRSLHPAAYISLKGKFVRQNKNALRKLIRQLSGEAVAMHPSHRVMEINETPRKLKITTSSTRLALQIGKELEDIYPGKTSYSFSKTNRLLRVRWRHD